MGIFDCFRRMPKLAAHDYRRKYRPVKRGGLGGGGNGDVRKVTVIATNELVALKCLKNEVKNDQERRLRFKDEINTMVAIGPSCPGVIPILDYSVEGCWYTMPIAEKIERECSDIDKTVDAVIQVAETLTQLHAQGYAHRDIKPMNMLYYNGRFVLCDFGLVDIPDNPHHLTRENQRLGAIRTIAPEMTRDPKHADGKKADVYSLAKTLWILLTGNKDCFDGRYNFMDNSMSLHQFDDLKKHHLVEIDRLLTDSTANNPEDRPAMTEFCEALKEWKRIKDNSTLMHLSNWNFIKGYMFQGEAPETSNWSNPQEIVNKLNILRVLPLYAHIFFPDRGWSQFMSAELAPEAGCIDLFTGLGIMRVKPVRMLFESFTQPFWNYFLLELQEQQVVVNTQVTDFEECVCEDTSGHYVNAEYFNYGVYDYDSGQKLPEGARLIHRYLKGKFLFIPKFGPYNSIGSADDGRHTFCTSEKFREYVGALQNVFNLRPNLEKEGKWNDVYDVMTNGCPYSPRPKEPKVSRTKPQNPDFVKDNYQKFDFSDILSAHQSMPMGKALFRFRFRTPNALDYLNGLFLKGEVCYLCQNGFVKNVKTDDTNIYEATDRETAFDIFRQLQEKLKEYCKDETDIFTESDFSVEVLKNGKPSHLFTRQEIEMLMRNEDDRHNNTLVIDEDGYAHIVHRRDEEDFYPVINTTWSAGNNSVGRYSTLHELDMAYHYSLGKWLDYLQYGVGQYRDDYLSHHESPAELVNLINKVNV